MILPRLGWPQTLTLMALVRGGTKDWTLTTCHWSWSAFSDRTEPNNSRVSWFLPSPLIPLFNSLYKVTKISLLSFENWLSSAYEVFDFKPNVVMKKSVAEVIESPTVCLKILNAWVSDSRWYIHKYRVIIDETMQQIDFLLFIGWKLSLCTLLQDLISNINIRYITQIEKLTRTRNHTILWRVWSSLSSPERILSVTDCFCMYSWWSKITVPWLKSIFKRRVS